MSTKTTFKRIALVTVAALGFGVMSVAPSSAASQADSLTVSAATGTLLTGETATAVTTTLNFLALADGDTLSVSALLTSAPLGNTALPQLALAETSSARVGATIAAGDKVVGDIIGQKAFVGPSAGVAPAAISAKFGIVLSTTGAPTATAVLAGTYVITLVTTVEAGGGVKNSTNQTVTITVGTNPALDKVAASATAYILATTDTTSATDAVLTASKDIPTGGNTRVGQIKVSLLNAAGKAADESYTAIVTSGPGLLGQQELDNSLAPGITGTLGRAITVNKANIVDIFPDGNSGVSTIQITSMAGKVLATKTLTFFGAATAITATVVKSVVGVGAGSDAILVTLKDAAGTTVSGSQAFAVQSSNTAAISGAYANQTVTYDAKNGTAGAGYLIDLTALAAGTANITVGTKLSAAATTGIEATPVAIRVGSSTPASVSVSFDKDEYMPGEAAVISVSLLDATGLVLADGRYENIFATGGITSSYSLGSLGDVALISETATRTFASGVQKYTVYMPVVETAIKFSWTTGTNLALANQGVAGSKTVTTVNSSTAAATAAAEEATAAALDATDAALDAAEAATLATEKAQEAVDAVAALTTRINTAVKNIRAQITALTKLVKSLL